MAARGGTSALQQNGSHGGFNDNFRLYATGCSCGGSRPFGMSREGGAMAVGNASGRVGTLRQLSLGSGFLRCPKVQACTPTPAPPTAQPADCRAAGRGEIPWQSCGEEAARCEPPHTLCLREGERRGEAPGTRLRPRLERFLQTARERAGLRGLPDGELAGREVKFCRCRSAPSPAPQAGNPEGRQESGP